MTQETAAGKKRQIPYDKAIKIVILASHYLGFGGWYGGVALDVESIAPFPAIATVSGVLLTVRELYKEGPGWLLIGEGVCTWAKVLILVAGMFAGRYEIVFLSVVLLLGILSSELPDKIRKNRLFG